MNKIPLLTLIIILSVAFVSIFEINVVNAQGIIFIRADGSVEGTDKIQREGDVYTFLEDIVVNGSAIEGIVIEKSNIVFDGAGFTLLGTGDEAGTAGISIRAQNCTVMNFKIENYFSGIVANSYNNSIFGNTIKNCRSGIYSLGGYSIIKYNTFEYNYYSIDSYYSPNPNIITNNNFKSYRGEYVMIVYLGAPPTIDNNYWSRYYGRDTNGDGVGDTPHVFEGPNNMQDDNPLMKPVDITVVPEFPSWIVLPLFLIVTLAIAFYRKKVWRQPLE